jgi:hypothetical protein
MQNSLNSEQNSYEDAFRDLVTRRRRRRIPNLLKRVDPRPTSPGQVLLVGLALAIIGWLIPVAHIAVTVGLALLVVGFLTGLMQPRSRQVVWRGRKIDLPADETWATRLYRTLYRGS